MIIRYLVDTDYLLNAANAPSCRGRLSVLVARFRSCLEENGQLISDKDGTIENRLRVLAKHLLETEENANGDDRDQTYDLRVAVDSLVECFAISALCSMIELPPGLKGGTSELIPYLSAAKHMPDCVFTDKPVAASGKAFVRATFADYFENSPTGVECRHKEWLRKKTYDEDTCESFYDYLAHFALGCREFKIIDRMIGKGKEDFLKSLAHVVLSLANVAHTRFTVLTARDVNIDPPKLLAEFKTRIKSLVATLTIDRRIQEIVVEFDFKKESDANEFHDRFVVSQTHYFSIGRGVDILKNGRYKLFNVYHCGGISPFPKDLEAICKAPSNQEKATTGPERIEAKDKTGVSVRFILLFVQPVKDSPIPF